MLTQKVLLILGAGASIPYGYPSGYSLTQQIISGTDSKHGRYFEWLIDHGFHEDEIKTFSEDLRLSAALSIDEFLQHRKEFRDIGKFCIACVLTPCESLSTLHEGKEGQWYSYLFHRLSSDMSAEDFMQNRLAVITFNYDRSLETFFHISFQHKYGLSPDKTEALLAALPIIHVHGDLGKLPVPYGAGRAYECPVDRYVLTDSASRIKIIHEDITEAPEFKEAQRLIEQADAICFLGFGFHPLNLDRLFPTPPGGALSDKLYGTSYGLPISEIPEAQRRFGQHLQLRPIKVLEALHDFPILI